MKYLLLIFSLVCFSAFPQKVIIVDTNTGDELEKEFPSKFKTIPDLENHLKVYYVLQKQRPSYDPLTEKLVPVKRFTDSIADGNNYPYVVKEWQKVTLQDSIIKINKEKDFKQKELDKLYNISDAEFRRYVLITLSALIDQNNKNALDPVQLEAIDSVYSYGNIVNKNYKSLKDSIKVNKLKIK